VKKGGECKERCNHVTDIEVEEVDGEEKLPVPGASVR